jgi:hypothetical protein
MSINRIAKESLFLRREFTADERLEMGRDLAQAHNRIAAIADEETSMKAVIKEKKAGVELTIGSLSRKLNDGYEMETVYCELVYDTPNVGEVTYLRPGGAIAKVRAMTISERQEELPFEDKVEVIPPAVAEASAEQSAENIEEFFKPGRPTEQPTAETAAPVVEEPDGDPSAEDLDAVAEEQAVAEATAEVPEGMSSWDAAVALLEKSATITAGLLQKNLEISYVQAAHIIDRMIEQKLISRDGSKLKVVKPKKSGPKELAAEHQKQIGAETNKQSPVDEIW